jgi:signal transduction histidine kinase
MLVHDLKAPMQSVLGFAELLQLGRAGPLQPDQRVFVEHIVQNGETLLALIARVLEVRSPAGSPDAELLEVGPVIRDVSNCMAGKAYTANVAIDVDVQTDAPPVSIDVIEFREVVQNLLDNAIQAAPAGTRILLRALQCGSSLCVEVTPAEPGRVGIRHAQSFDLLRHAPEADHRRRTPHLGLHIVRDIAERNNGELWAEPATNGGLAFKFILPAGPAGRAAGCA